MQIEGQAAIVSGVASGLGRAAAQALAAAGVNEAVAAETPRETSWFATTPT